MSRKRQRMARGHSWRGVTGGKFSPPCFQRQAFLGSRRALGCCTLLCHAERLGDLGWKRVVLMWDGGQALGRGSMHFQGFSGVCQAMNLAKLRVAG